jgi:hypothetical protein
MKDALIYLASPYSHPSAAVRSSRHEETLFWANVLMGYGRLIFSPIVYGHPLAENASLSCDFEYWENLDLTILSRCDSLLVLQLDQWEKSKGIERETAKARELGIVVEYMRPINREFKSCTIGPEIQR